MSSAPHLMQEAASEYRSRTDAKLAALSAKLAPLAGKEQRQDRAEVPSAAAAAAHADLGAAELKQRAQELAAKMAHPHEEAVVLSPSETKEVEKLLADIGELKAKLTRSEGIFTRLLRVSEQRQREQHDRRRGELEQLRSDVAAHKRRLSDERGCGPNDLGHDPDVAELEERLAALHKFGGA